MKIYNLREPKGWSVVLCLLGLVPLGSGTLAAKNVGSEISLSPSGEKLLAKYSDAIRSLQEQIGESVSKIDETQSAAFLKAHAAEESGPDAVVALARAQAATLTLEKPILAKVEGFLISDKLDARLIRSAVPANATRGGEDFLLESQARESPKEYIKVLRAQWAADALGEVKVNGLRLGKGGLWNALALNQKMAMVAEAKPAEVALAGEDLAESNDSSKAEAINKAEFTAEDKKIVFATDGSIVIPPAACMTPRHNTANILFMKSFAGGMQLHHRQIEALENAFDAPTGGKYSLTARVVTVHKDQHLLLATNDSKATLDIAVPYTIGSGQESKPLEIELDKGKNLLHFTRNAPNYGVTVKQFTLTPLK